MAGSPRRDPQALRELVTRTRRDAATLAETAIKAEDEARQAHRRAQELARIVDARLHRLRNRPSS